MKVHLIATAAFGLEAVVRREIEALGYKIIRTEDGKVTFLGDERAIVRSNLWLRTADRVYIRMGEFTAETFEDLFQQVKALPWADIIPADGEFPVVGTSVKSTLHSVPACQSIIKKAVVSALSERYMIEQFPETGALYRIRFAALKNRFTLEIDTSGVGLHKRGYRQHEVAAPIKETLASAMLQLSFWRKDRILVDTCCGSGTIPIEAAMLARNIAPGLTRRFASDEWDIIDQDIWREEKRRAYSVIDFDTPLRIYGYDTDKRAIEACYANAEAAGVDEDITFLHKDMRNFESSEYGQYGVIVTNPPYGERIGEKEKIHRIYQKLASVMKNDPTWSVFMITTEKDVEKKYFGRKADRRRKLYNGSLEAQYYQFHGRRPPRRNSMEDPVTSDERIDPEKHGKEHKRPKR